MKYYNNNKIKSKYLIILFTSIVVFICITLVSIFYYKYLKSKWSIGIYSGNTPFNMENKNWFNNPVLDKNNVPDSEFVADPFIIKENDMWYMFFEVFRKSTKQGDIGYATSENGYTWIYRGVVINEKFHLSFPYVFKFNGNYYMIPESSEDSTIRLYIATRFPDKWNLKKIILDNVKYVDPSVVYNNGYWWLFASNLNNDMLRLFYTTDLMGEWKEHIKSPVIMGDNTISRSAGRILVLNDVIYRFTQDCSRNYGEGIRAYKITKLDKFNYEEFPVNENRFIVNAGSSTWNINGVHTINLYKNTDNTWIACVDGNGYNNYLEIMIIKINGFKNRFLTLMNYYYKRISKDNEYNIIHMIYA